MTANTLRNEVISVKFNVKHFQDYSLNKSITSSIAHDNYVDEWLGNWQYINLEHVVTSDKIEISEEIPQNR